jgi:hypothetical protein
MHIPFTVEQFLEVFVRFNEAIWPAQLGAYALGIAVLAVALRGGGLSTWAVPWLLAGAWGFVGVAYHVLFFAEVNPAARGFGAAFLVQAALLAWAGARRRTAFRWSPTPRGAAGLALVVYAMALYPLLGAASGHAYPAAPVFGVTPCPTGIFTFGVLLLAVGPVPWWLLVVPTLWALVGTSAALQLGVREDLGLPVAAALAAGFLLLRPRGRAAGGVGLARCCSIRPLNASGLSLSARASA